MSYAATLARLHALQRFGVRPGLEAIRAALVRLGTPERAFDVIHIAGSNGKGSTAAMCEAVLRADGRRVGLYTSPHLARYTERIRIGGAEIAEDELAALADLVLVAGPELTFFEVATAIAFLAFARAGVELAVVEVGLGGRLDATSVVARPVVSVITGIALEHTELLGRTVGAIAREKAGILRRGVPAVAAARDEEVRRAIDAVAAQVGAPIAWLGEDFAVSAEDSALRFRDGETQVLLPPLSLSGAHQLDNAALALAALGRLPVALRPGELALAAVAGTRWPGRLERIGEVVLDGAHNADGARALAAALLAIAGHRRRALVLGLVADKDAEAIVAPLLPHFERVVVTTVPNPRALVADELARRIAPLVAERSIALELVPDPMDALLAAGRDGSLCVVAGSLFLVGHLRARLLGERVDPILAQDPAPAGGAPGS